uniref:Uncharacterized protein n=1 Tax=Candidatus Kentrum sp. TC TaxID=2126339 RepID=A0A450Z991_9GAMM|nr:MAG: hypothetical protein BECKTC1821D_GA0114238_11008 [Candidatus Kentron sp. TC]
MRFPLRVSSLPFRTMHQVRSAGTHSPIPLKRFLLLVSSSPGISLVLPCPTPLLSAISRSNSKMLRLTPILQIEYQFPYRFLSALSRPVPMTSFHEVLFIYRRQYFGAAQLHELVFQCWYSQRPFFPWVRTLAAPAWLDIVFPSVSLPDSEYSPSNLFVIPLPFSYPFRWLLPCSVPSSIP